MGSGAEPQPKSNLVHFSLKIRHLVAKILMIVVKSQLTEKQVVYIAKTIFTIGLMEVSLLSPGNINILLRCNFTNASAYIGLHRPAPSSVISRLTCFSSSLRCCWQVGSAPFVRRRCDCLASSAPFTNIQTYLLTYLHVHNRRKHRHITHYKKVIYIVLSS